jgi:hypothetical protein
MDIIKNGPQDYVVEDEENSYNADLPSATPEQREETDDPANSYPDDQDTRHILEIPTEDLVGDKETAEIDNDDAIARREAELAAE